VSPEIEHIVFVVSYLEIRRMLVIMHLLKMVGTLFIRKKG
jgi:hypothetical protein